MRGLKNFNPWNIFLPEGIETLYAQKLSNF